MLVNRSKRAENAQADADGFRSNTFMNNINLDLMDDVNSSSNASAALEVKEIPWER